MNYIYRLIIILVSSQSAFCAMRATFFKPSYWQEKPRFDRKNMTTAELTYTYAKATQSFNSDREKVPLFSYRGPEPLLANFIDPAIKKKNLVTYGAFDGKYKSQTIWATIIQNIKESFFLELTSSISYDCLKNIVITPVESDGTRILYPSKKIKAYIEALNSELFSSKNAQNRTYVGPSYLMFGYTKSFNEFEYVDMVDISVQTGLVVPVIIIDYPQSDFYLFPRQDIFNLGIPVQINAMCGLYDWLNIGATASVIAYLPNDLIVPLNKYPYCNKIIIPQSELSTIKTHPLVGFSAYIEGEYLVPHWTWFIGFSYTRQFKTNLESCDPKKFPYRLINKYTIQYPWQQFALTFSSEIDFSCEEKKFMPRCKFVYVTRVGSKNCFATSLFTGQLGLEVLYDF